MTRQRYDVIVVGGGPAGSMCAWKAAEAGMSVLLLEKDREIGMPVRCGEGTSLKELTRFLPIDERWISQRTKRLNMVAPDGTKVLINTEDLGCVLDRRLFDRELARRAGETGAEIWTRAYVCGLEMSDNTMTGVQVVRQGQQQSIRARIVVGADGVESRVGRMAGIKTHVAPKDMDVCYQMTLANVDVDQDSCEMYFGSEVAPGGYAWIFPKGNRSANVGMGISGDNGKNGSALKYFRQFVASHFDSYTVLNEVAGGVPCVPTLKQITAPGLMLVGDAARQVNPLTGGGIISAMTAGQIAGEVAAAAIRKGDVSMEGLKAYPERWDKAGGKEHRVLYRLKKAAFGLNDRALNRTAHAMVKLPASNRDFVTLFKTAFIKTPSIWVDVVRVFT